MVVVVVLQHRRRAGVKSRVHLGKRCGSDSQPISSQSTESVRVHHHKASE